MNYTLILVIALILYVIGRRIISGTRGVKYSVRSIFLRPIIYIVLSAILMLGLELWQIGVLVAAILAGIFLGKWLGKKSNIFEKDGAVMYKRSNVILGLWIAAFVIRLAIDFLTDPELFGATGSSAPTIATVLAAAQHNPIVFFADILLALTAGLLLGEALILYRDFNKRPKKSS